MALSLYYLTSGYVYLVFHQMSVLDQLTGLDLCAPSWYWEICPWVQIQGLYEEKPSSIRWFMLVCLLSSSCLGQLGERVWKKLDTWTRRGTSFPSVLGMWLLALSTGLGRCRLFLGGFFCPGLRSVQNLKGRGKGMKTVLRGAVKNNILWSWDNKQWPTMIVTERLQKHWEKGKHHSAAMESWSSWSFSSWTSFQMAGKSTGLAGAQKCMGVCYSKAWYPLGTDGRNTSEDTEHLFDSLF